MDRSLVSDSFLLKYFEITKSDQILRQLDLGRSPCTYVKISEMLQLWILIHQITNLTKMSVISVSSDTSKMTLVSPLEKKWTFCKVVIIRCNKYLSFRAWLILYLTISRMFHLTKCELAKAFLDTTQRPA